MTVSIKNSAFKRVLFRATAALALLGSLAACGGHRDGGWSNERMEAMKGRAVERVGKKLELDAAQKTKLDALAMAVMAQREALRKSGTGGDLRSAARAVIAGDKFDRTAARQLLDQKTGAVQAQAPQVLDAMAQFFDSLQPAQQAQVRAMLDQRGRGRW